MYISPDEMRMLKSPEIRNLQKKYLEKTGVRHPGFNRDDFAGMTDYINTLKKSIETGIPWVWKGDEE